MGEVKPTNPDGYADHLSGNWGDVPDWAIARINFLEEQLKFKRERIAPLMYNDCPACPGFSCDAVKNCYSYLCDGRCGSTNEIFVNDEEKAQIYRAREHL